MAGLRRPSRPDSYRVPTARQSSAVEYNLDKPKRASARAVLIGPSQRGGLRPRPFCGTANVLLDSKPETAELVGPLAIPNGRYFVTKRKVYWSNQSRRFPQYIAMYTRYALHPLILPPPPKTLYSPPK